MDRLDSKAYNRKVLESLIKAGAFDSTGYTRKQLMYFVDETPLLESAAKRQKDRMNGQVSFFDMFADEEGSGFCDEVPEPDGMEWDRKTLLAFEKEILGIYVSDHPLNPYQNALARIAKYSIGDLLEAEKDRSGTFAGMISGVGTRLTKKNKKMATFTLEDTTGQVEAICFDYDKNADALFEDAIVQVKGKFEHTDRGNQMICYEVKESELSEADANRLPEKLELRIGAGDFSQTVSIQLGQLLKQFPGHDGVVLFVSQNDGRCFRAELPTTVDAHNSALLSRIAALFGRAVWKNAS